MSKPKNPVRPDEVIAFDVYFASLASMQVHPGAGTKGHEPLTPEECCARVLHMLEIRRAVLTPPTEE